MIAQLRDRVPDSLAAYRGGVAMRPGGPGSHPLSALRERDVFDALLARFGASLGEDLREDLGSVDRRALVSYWTQFYFAVLATPALTALVRLGRPLPLAFDETSLELDEAGRPACLLIRPAEIGAAASSQSGRIRGLSELIDGHLRPFVALCCAHYGLAPRVLWGNAAAIFDYVAGELEDGTPPCRLAPTCGSVCGAQAGASSPLAAAICTDASGCRRRRVCCLRYVLPGVPSCGTLCPAAAAGAPAPPHSP